MFMVQTLDRQYLHELLSKGKHSTGKAIDILPFSSRRAKYRDQFKGVLGELIRIICEVEIDTKKFSNNEYYLIEEENPMSEYIAKSVDFKDEEAKYDFVRFLNEYLFNENEIKPIHPYLFNYIEVEDIGTNKNELKKFSQFIFDIQFRDNSNIKTIFNNKEADDILTELVLNNLDSLKPRKSNNQHYQPLMNTLIEQYQEDMVYLSHYKDYFLTSFPLLTQYYTFMYVCQLIIKFEQFTGGNLDNVQPIYFALDWESINKRRKSASDLEGFRFIKEKASNLFPHVHTLSQLSHNSFNVELEKENKKLRVYSYQELYGMIQQEGKEFEEKFLQDLKLWIEDYRELKGISTPDSSDNIADAFQFLFNCLKEGMNSDVSEKYGKNIEDLGAAHFIKSRGSLGQVLNIKHDFLLLLTAISVKDHRIPLNELFIEFEKRGVAFDRYSKKEIINLLDDLNILDKKSDSGDSQYVKPIL